MELLLQQFFIAVDSNDAGTVRALLSSHKDLLKVRNKNYAYDSAVSNAAVQFLGAYLGGMTGLQVAVLKSFDDMARDIMDISFQEDLDATFGGGNSVLHLATFLGSKEIVRKLLDRNVNDKVKVSALLRHV